MFYRFLFLFFMSMNAWADLSIQGLPPASGLSFSFTETANTNVIRGKMIKPGSVFLNTQYGYINHPLTKSDGVKSSDLVTGLQTLDARIGVLIKEDLNFSLNLSLNSLNMPHQPSRQVLGDSVAQMKYRLTSPTKPTLLALIPELYLPVGSEKDYLSTGELGGALRVALTHQFGKVKVGTNVGYRYSPGAKLKELNYERQIIAGLSSEIPLTDKFSINAEMIGFISTPYEEKNSTGEIYAGALYAFNPLTVLTAGLSRSGIGNADNQSFRGIAGFKHYFDESPDPLPVKSVETPACFIEPYTNTFHSRPLTDAEQANVVRKLPYKNKSAQYLGATVDMKTLRYGEMTGITKSGYAYVKDSQIPFAIDLTDIPELKSIKTINHAWLKMKVNKLSQDSYLGTEILCSLNFKLCSGGTLERDKWYPLFNPVFFDEEKRLYNNHFEKLYLDTPVGEVNGEKLYSKMLTFSLQDLIQGSQVQLKHFFQKTKQGKKSLYFVIADDTFLSNEVSLEVSMGVERCYKKR